MAVELDPLFLQAIHLLNSRHPDSARQLKELVQGYREKITGETRHEKVEKKEIIIDRSSPKSVEKSVHSTDRSMSPVFSGPVTGTSISQKNDSRPASIEVVETVEEMSSSSFGDNIREEQMDAILVEDMEELANTNFGEAVIEELVSSSLLEPATKKSKQEDDASSSFSEEDESNEVLLDEPLEDLDGPMCCVCQSHETDSADNCLVECHECHKYYHQRCHRPAMTNKDVHDPRFVLYCSQCSRKVKKEIQAAQKSSSSSTSSTTQEPAVAKPIANPFQVKPSIQPFRRPASIDSSKASTSAFMSNTLLPNNGNNGQSANSQRGSGTLPSDLRMKSMKRLEQVKKRAKAQTQMRKR